MTSVHYLAEVAELQSAIGVSVKPSFSSHELVSPLNVHRSPVFLSHANLFNPGVLQG